MNLFKRPERTSESYGRRRKVCKPLVLVQGCLLQDLVLVRPRVSFPKSTGGARPVYGYSKEISDSASSVHVSANGLQNSLPLEEQGGRQSVSARYLACPSEHLSARQ